MTSPTLIAFFACASVASFVYWYWSISEKEYNTFLKKKLAHKSSNEGKSEKQIEIEERLKNVGNPVTYAQLKQWSLMAMVIPPIFLTALGAPLFSIITIILGYKLPDFYLSQQEAKKIELFSDNLVDALGQLLAVIQAGQTQTQGFRILSEQPYPIGTEFGRIYQDIKTGASLKQALDDFYERIPLRDVRMLNIGMIIAQSAAPTVSINTLQNIISTTQKRESQKKSIKSAVIGGQMTALIISLFPLVAFIGVLTIMPDMMGEFIDSGTGKIALFAAAVMDGIGFYFARRITSSKRMIDY